MTYQVLYRAWRPQDFDELVGQEPIRRTLENAITQNRISHAYLFAGPRGTGKTSTARILAKALNCTQPKGTQSCGKCDSCLSIQNGNSMDVLEIDAASNRGIEEIRELKEKMGYMPALGKYKVYIIDEVHMLTTEAFNALLKTLEEPPGHVIFVLATTNVQKLPATILSRCQRFDFRKITPLVIEKRLKEIIDSLDIEVAEGVYALITKRADGGLRDAISLLDQCLSYSPESLDTDTVYKVLGLVRQDAVVNLTQAILVNDSQSLFLQLDQLIREGVEPFQILRDLAEHIRNLMMLLICGQNTDLISATSEERTVMLQQAKSLGVQRLQAILTTLDQGLFNSKLRGNSRFMVEALLAGLMILPQETLKQVTTPTTPTTPTMPAIPVKATKPATAKNEAKPEIIMNKAPNKTNKPAPAKVAADKNWEQIMLEVKIQKIVLHAYLTASVEQIFENQTFTINFDPEKGKFHKERAEEAENRRILQEIINQVMAEDIKLEFGFKAKQEELDPIKKAMAIFGEDIVQIKK